MPAGLGDYLKRNAKFAYGGGILGAPFLVGDLKSIFDADNKLKALLKTMKDFALARVAMVGVFTAVGAAVRSLVRDTGALDAAFKRLSQNQFLTRQLQSFVGGLNAARQRVAQLNVISARGPFKFEAIAEANKNLEVFTRGAYSSVQATQEIGRVAIATGNSIEDTSRVVSTFYDQLRNGQPVQSTTEQMRQMGIISQSTADNLDQMAEGGESVARTFQTLQSAMAETARGAKGYRDDISTVTAEHDKARASLGAEFAMPFTENEVKNVQNYTAAMKAITPTVGAIGKSLAIVYNGFSTAVSGLTKWIAGTKVAQGVASGFVTVIEALSVGLVAYGTYAAVTLTPIIIKLTGALTGMGTAGLIAGNALRAIALASVWGAVVVALAGVVGMIINFRQQTQRAVEEHRKWEKSHREATAAILAEAAAVKTLAERNAVLAKSMDRITELQKEQRDAEKKHRDEQKKTAEAEKYGAGGDPYAEEAYNRRKQAAEDQFQSESRLRKGEISDLNDVNNRMTQQKLTNQQIVETEVRRQTALEEMSKGVEQRDREATANLKARQTVTNQNAESEKRVLELQTRINNERQKLSDIAESDQVGRLNVQARLAKNERSLTDELVSQQRVAMEAPEGSAVKLEAQLDRQRNAQEVLRLETKIAEQQKLGAKPGELFEDRMKLSRARALAGGETFDPNKFMQLSVQMGVAKEKEARAGTYEAEKRSARFEEFGIQASLQEHAARRRGDIRQAQTFQDLGRFAKTFEDLIPIFGEQKAAQIAQAQTEDEIKQEYMTPAVVSSLQAVGGGGNVASTPMLEAARRQEALQQQMVELLKALVGTPDQAQAAATFAP